MKNSTKAHIGYCVSKLASWAFAIIAAMEMFVQFIMNLNYFDTHYSVAGQYPEGLFFRIIGVPAILFGLAIVSRTVMQICRKLYIYEKNEEKKRR